MPTPQRLWFHHQVMPQKMRIHPTPVHVSYPSLQQHASPFSTKALGNDVRTVAQQLFSFFHDFDSDFDLPIGVAEPTEPPLLRDLLLVAKLYGHDALVEPPPDDIEWDLKDVSLHADGTLWHVEDDLVGMLDLQNVVAQGYTAGTSDEICLSQAGKCHLLRIGEGGKVPLKDWSDAVARFVPR